MTKERKAFMAIDADIDDSRLEQLAAAKGVGAMTPPAEPSLPQHAARKSAVSGLMPSPRNTMKRLGLELPPYAWTDLRIKAAERGWTVRYFVMQALKQQGVVIHDVDMIEDGRREGGGASQPEPVEARTGHS